MIQVARSHEIKILVVFLTYLNLFLNCTILNTTGMTRLKRYPTFQKNVLPSSAGPSHTRREPCKMCPCYLLRSLNDLSLFFLFFSSSPSFVRFNFQIDIFYEQILIPSFSFSSRITYSSCYVTQNFCYAVLRCRLPVEMVSRRPLKHMCCLIPNSSVWDLRCTKWYWERFRSEHWVSLPVIPPMLHTHLLVYHRRYVAYTINNAVK
jgi:hypothetical protein